MVSFESFKEKALATAGKVADKSVFFARTAGEKAKILGKITKLKTEIAMEKDTVRKSFVEIGKLYYEKHKDNPTPEMTQAVEEITLSLQIVADKKLEVEALKKELVDDLGDMEVEEEVGKDTEDDVDQVMDDIVDKEKNEEDK